MESFVPDGPTELGLGPTLKRQRDHSAGESLLPRYPKQLVNKRGEIKIAASVSDEVLLRTDGFKEQGE